MSITFSFCEQDPVGGFLVHGVACEHGPCTHGMNGRPCDEYDVYHCCDHTEAALVACGCKAFDVNLSNHNAMAVLERLGLTEDYGEVDAEDMIGRCLLANIGRDDSGVPTVESRGELGARVIDCGVRAGYYEETLARICDLAVEAKRRGVLVGWC